MIQRILVTFLIGVSICAAGCSPDSGSSAGSCEANECTTVYPPTGDTWCCPNTAPYYCHDANACYPSWTAAYEDNPGGCSAPTDPLDC